MDRRAALRVLDAQICAHGATPAGVRQVLRQLGHRDPDAIMVRHLPAVLGLEMDVDDAPAPPSAGAVEAAADAVRAALADQQLAAMGATRAGVEAVLRSLGNKDPRGTLTKFGGR